MENLPPPSRHPGSRIVAKDPNLIRSVADIRARLTTDQNRVKREEVMVTEAAPSAGVACTSATMIDTHKTRVARSGYAIFFDLAAGTGGGSVMEARVSVPALGIFGPAVQTPSGGTDRDLQITLAMPDAWDIGVAYRVFVQARRVSGGDATTMQVMRAWQR